MNIAQIPLLADLSPGQIVAIAVGGFLLILFLIFLALFFRYFNLWFRGFVTKARIGPLALVVICLLYTSDAADE